MGGMISSLQNARVKSAARLRGRRGRDRQRRIIVDGVRETARAFAAGVEILELFVCERLCSKEGSELVQAVSGGPSEVWTVRADVFEKLAFGDRSEGLVAVCRPPSVELDQIALDDNALVVVIQSVEKPGNVGAVLRSADAVGARAVVLADGGTDPFNPNAIRSSLGAVFAVPVCVASSEATLAWLRRHGLAMFAARVDGAVSYTQVSYCAPSAVILGSEATGLSDVWLADDITAVSLPMCGVVDSLNVSTTAAVLLYEALRQRAAADSGTATR
jgi:TrmH family RNA methyltransferase